MTPAKDPKQASKAAAAAAAAAAAETAAKISDFLVFSSFFVGILGQNHSQNVRTTRPVILNRSQPPPTTPIPFYNIFT